LIESGELLLRRGLAAAASVKIRTKVDLHAEARHRGKSVVSQIVAFPSKDKFVRLSATKAARIPRHEMDARSYKAPDRHIFAKTCVRLRTVYAH
jgi:hypothetical protein